MRPGTPPASRPANTTTKDADLIRDRRERLIRAAIKVFGEKGFHESTVRDIGGAARLTEGTIYNYVRGKEDILFLVLPDDVHRSLLERHRDHSSLWITLQDRT
jgi:AcrR family transcriptional regulator